MYFMVPGSSVSHDVATEDLVNCKAVVDVVHRICVPKVDLKASILDSVAIFGVVG